MVSAKAMASAQAAQAMGGSVRAMGLMRAAWSPYQAWDVCRP